MNLCKTDACGHQIEAHTVLIVKDLPSSSRGGCNVGWLGWLAGCSWRAAAGWLTEIRKLAWKVGS